METKEPKVRIVSGGPACVETEVNRLLVEYTPMMWNVQPGKEGPLVTCILIHQSEIRQSQIAAARQQAAGIAYPGFTR